MEYLNPIRDARVDFNCTPIGDKPGNQTTQFVPNLFDRTRANLFRSGSGSLIKRFWGTKILQPDHKAPLNENYGLRPISAFQSYMLANSSVNNGGPLTGARFGSLWRFVTILK